MGAITDKAAEAVQSIGGFAAAIIERIKDEARVVIPESLSTPYKTNMYVGNRRVMEVKIGLGPLPNGTTKVVPVPKAITDIWDPSTAYLDTANCYARSRTSGTSLTLPHATSRDNYQSDNGIQLVLFVDEIYTKCRLNASNYDGFATIRYLEAETTE